MEVLLHRYSRFHGCSVFIAIDPETSPKLFHLFTHPVDAKIVPSVSRLHQCLTCMTLTTVAHRQLEPARFAMQQNLCYRTPRVAQHIREPFLHNAEDCNLPLIATPAEIRTDIQRHANPPALFKSLPHPTHSLTQPLLT